MTMPAEPLSETLRARRPPAEVGVTSTVPPSFSSRTMLETVAADRPVVRAISAWVSEPAMPHGPYDPLKVGPVQ